MIVDEGSARGPQTPVILTGLNERRNGCFGSCDALATILFGLLIFIDKVEEWTQAFRPIVGG